jgi:hypothetical protein
MFGGGIHDQWYQWFAGPENEDDEKHPGRYVAGLIGMDMGMVDDVAVSM